MSIAKVTRNYQVTIPRDIRTLHDIKIGDTLVFAPEDDRIEVLKFEEDIIEKAFGSWKELKETGIEYQKRMRSEWKKREQRLWKQR